MGENEVFSFSSFHLAGVMRHNNMPNTLMDTINKTWKKSAERQEQKKTILIQTD